MIWALLLSATVLVRRDEHVRMDLIIQSLPPRVSKAIGLILSLAIFVFLLVYTVFGLEAALENLNVRDGSIRISMFWPLLIIPISGALMFLNLVVLIYETIFTRSET
jgi:TRAP-type C4-dicarboxylate transport system permease small subunit